MIRTRTQYQVACDECRLPITDWRAHPEHAALDLPALIERGEAHPVGNVTDLTADTPLRCEMCGPAPSTEGDS